MMDLFSALGALGNRLSSLDLVLVICAWLIFRVYTSKADKRVANARLVIHSLIGIAALAAIFRAIPLVQNFIIAIRVPNQ